MDFDVDALLADLAKVYNHHGVDSWSDVPDHLLASTSFIHVFNMKTLLDDVTTSRIVAIAR